MEEPVAKVRKPLDAEALEKLAKAREKANAKRKELAVQRHAEKESLIQTKMKEKQVKNERVAEMEAEKRLITPPQPLEEEEETAPEPKRKKQPVVIETSDSEDDISNARVYFVKRERAQVPEPPRQRPPDPHAALYAAMFNGHL